VPETTKLSGLSGGNSVAPAIRSTLEGSLGGDVGSVGGHTQPTRPGKALARSARAVPYGRHILLGPGEEPTDLALMSHEVAHVVQQEGAPKIQKWSASGGDACE